MLRAHTAMYMGVRKLSALSSFLDGWRFALNVYDIEFIDPLPRDFHEWVAYPLHFRESTSGYKNMILERVPDKKARLSDRFFELLDEYRMRHARVVARLSAFAGREYFLRFKSDGNQQRTFPAHWRLGLIPSISSPTQTIRASLFSSSLMIPLFHPPDVSIRS